MDKQNEASSIAKVADEQLEGIVGGGSEDQIGAATAKRRSYKCENAANESPATERMT